MLRSDHDIRLAVARHERALRERARPADPLTVGRTPSGPPRRSLTRRRTSRS